MTSLSVRSSSAGYWGLRWVEAGRRRETTAASRDEVLAKAADVVARLAQGRPTDWGRATGEALVAHYLDPNRRSARGRAWSARHREEQQAYCARFVVPVIATVELRRLTRGDFAQILAQAPTASVAPLRRCCSPWSPPAWTRGWCWPPRPAAGRALVTAARALP
jgi:hypothetical protein